MIKLLEPSVPVP